MPFLYLLINCISARTAPQILSPKGECISNFLIIGLCNSSANSLFEIFPFLIPLPEKIYKSLKQGHVDIHHILDF